MKTRTAVAVLLLLACPAIGFAQKPKAVKPVVVRHDKTVDFTKFRTYSYQQGQPAILKDVDARIVADLEAQLQAVGLTRAPEGSGDVVVTYYSVTRTDVDLATFDRQEPAAGTQRKMAETYTVGTLVVDVKPADAAAPAWRVKIDEVLAGDAAAQLKTVDGAVAAIFSVYPTRAK